MSTTSLNSITEIFEEKKKILNWILTWMKQPKALFENAEFDISEIAVFLKCLGFTLENFEETEEYQCSNNKIITVQLNCASSKIKAYFTKEITTCKCPEDISKASYWNISGFGPQNQEKIAERECSLLPVVTQARRKVISEFLHKMILRDVDINQNDDFKLETARYRSLDALNDTSSECSSLSLPLNPLDQKITPPSKTSSPLPNLYSNLQLVHTEAAKLIVHLNEMQDLIINNLGVMDKNNSTFTKDTSRRSSNGSKSTTPRPIKKIRKNSVKKLLSPKQNITSSLRNKFLYPSSKIILRTASSSSITPNSISKLPRKDTPRPIVDNKTSNLPTPSAIPKINISSPSQNNFSKTSTSSSTTTNKSIATIKAIRPLKYRSPLAENSASRLTGAISKKK